MKFGIGPFTCQVPSESSRSFEDEYDAFLRAIETAEDAGFDEAWVSEHHFTRDGAMNSPLEAASAALARTDDIRVGTAIAIAPYYNPVRLAESTATTSVIGDGRFDLGLGLGYREEEFERFEADMHMRVRRLKETVALLRRAWTGESVDFDGMAFEYDDALVRPSTTESPRIFIGGFARQAVERAAQIGDGHLVGPKNLDDVEPRLETIRETLAEEDREDERFSNVVQVDLFVAEEDAWEKVEDSFRYFMQRFADWNFDGDLSEERFQKAREQAVFGTPEEVVAELETYRDRLSDDIHIMGKFMYPTMNPELVREGIELFGEEVIPRLKN